MSTPAPPPAALVDLRELRLETAHALLAQAAGSAPPRPGAGAPGGAGQAPARYLQGLIDGLCELSAQDPLTGLLRAPQLAALLEREIDRATRSGEAALLLCMALDGLDQACAAQGAPPAGNALLQALARRLAASVRPMDSLARHGSAEFALVLPACPPPFAAQVAARLHDSAAALLAASGPSPVALTISTGGAFALPAGGQSAQQWRARADAQLARARAAGANCVRIEELPGSAVSTEEKSLLFGAQPGGNAPPPRQRQRARAAPGQ